MKLKIFRLSASKIVLVALLVVAWQSEAQAPKTLNSTMVPRYPMLSEPGSGTGIPI